MGRAVWLEHLGAAGLRWAQETVTRHHYRRAPVPARACPEGWAVCAAGLGTIGCLIVGRPQATVCRPLYGAVGEAAAGAVEVTRWQVLNLARVWLSPAVQPGGAWHGPAAGLPGFADRRGVWRSTLASGAIGALARIVGYAYLEARPPVFLDEPYEVRWLISYCDPAHHRGTIYRASGFALYRTNAAGLQTYRLPLPRLAAAEDAAIREASRVSARARRFRARRASAQLALPLG